MTVTPTKDAHVTPSPPKDVRSSMTDIAMGDNKLPMRTNPIATAIVVRTTEFMDKLAMIIELSIILFVQFGYQPLINTAA